MADKCNDLTIVRRAINFLPLDTVPAEHFLQIVPLNSANAKTMNSTLVKFLKEKNICSDQARKNQL